MTTTTRITPESLLSDLAVTRAGASRVLQRHGLDFCCHGRISLADACGPKRVDVQALIAEIEREERATPAFERWDHEPLGALMDYLLEHFHEGHRVEVPQLVEMAEKVERVHADKPTCPRGLTAHLAHMHESLEEHMQKEEQVLFPMIRAGRGAMAGMPVQIMEEEHQDHGRNLERLRALCGDFVPPAEACGTWRALYLRLAELESELMHHIHLENNVLFPRALRG